MDIKDDKDLVYGSELFEIWATFINNTNAKAAPALHIPSIEIIAPGVPRFVPNKHTRNIILNIEPIYSGGSSEASDNSVELKNVSYRYDGASSDAVSNISLIAQDFHNVDLTALGPLAVV